MTDGELLTQNCGCPACVDIRDLVSINNGIYWRGLPQERKHELFDKHYRYTDPDYGMSDMAIIKRDIKKIFKLLEGKNEQ